MEFPSGAGDQKLAIDRYDNGRGGSGSFKGECASRIISAKRKGRGETIFFVPFDS